MRLVLGLFLVNARRQIQNPLTFVYNFLSGWQTNDMNGLKDYRRYPVRELQAIITILATHLSSIISLKCFKLLGVFFFTCLLTVRLDLASDFVAISIIFIQTIILFCNVCKMVCIFIDFSRGWIWCGDGLVNKCDVFGHSEFSWKINCHISHQYRRRCSLLWRDSRLISSSLNLIHSIHSTYGSYLS